MYASLCSVCVLGSAAIIWLSVGPIYIPYFSYPFERGQYGRLFPPTLVAGLAIVLSAAATRISNKGSRIGLTVASLLLWGYALGDALENLLLLQGFPFGW